MPWKIIRETIGESEDGRKEECSANIRNALLICLEKNPEMNSEVHIYS
jgi:hypothetical protein